MSDVEIIIEQDVTVVDTPAQGPTGPAAWLPVAAWAPSTGYASIAPASVVTEAGECYVCMTGHTSGTVFSPANWTKIAAKGAQGAPNTLSIGTVSTLDPGADATSTINGTPPNQTLNLGIPRGAAWWSGTADPNNANGENGDYYEQTGTGATGVIGDIWFKSSGAWAKIGNNRGAQGLKGDTGDTGPGYGGTSTTSRTVVDSGSVQLDTQTGLAYSVGARIRAASAGTGEWMEGVVSAYSAGSLTFTADQKQGTGTHADWNINLTGIPGAGNGDVIGPVSSVNNNVAVFNGLTGKLLKDGGTLGSAAWRAETYFQTALGYTAANKAGDTFNGKITVIDDICTYRTGATATGYIFFNYANTAYMGWDGSTYKAGTSNIWHSGNFTPATVATSGSYTDLSNKPSIPPIPSSSSDYPVGMSMIVVTVQNVTVNDNATVAGSNIRPGNGDGNTGYWTVSGGALSGTWKNISGTSISGQWMIFQAVRTA